MNSLDPQFEQRKKDHLAIALHESCQAFALSGLDEVRLQHHSLPDLNLSEVSIQSTILNREIATPFFIAGMTSGHAAAGWINLTLGKAAQNRGWIFGFGSQRKQIMLNAWEEADRQFAQELPMLNAVGNLGIAQLIELVASKTQSELEEAMGMIASVGCRFFAVHLNPLQEAVQNEGTPNFKNSVKALKTFIKLSPLPVVVKETGSGMSKETLQLLREVRPFAVDVSGLGGTHWGRVEATRNRAQLVNEKASHFNGAFVGDAFANWGISTVDSVKNAAEIFKGTSTEIWASGGVRNGLDAAKLIALGAHRVGFGKAALEVLVNQPEHAEKMLEQWMESVERELRIALFCTNSASLKDLRGKCV